MSTINNTASIIAGINSGKLSPIPWTNAIINWIPAFIIVGRFSTINVARLVIIWTTTGSNLGIIEVIPSIIDCNKFIPVSINCGRYSTNFSDKLSTNWTIPCIIISTLGSIFSPTVTILSTKLSIKPWKLTLSSAIPVSKFCQALFIDANDPDIVELASFAVVPVIPSSPCITWIAWYTSFKLLISYSTPLIAVASASNLSISVFVPP